MCTSAMSITLSVIEKFIIPIVIATITYWLFKKNDDYIKRRQYSILGVAIMESLLEEVNNGITIMSNKTLSQLPVKSWDGLNTISDDVLLRIIAVSKNVQPVAFPPREIRIHCKNYFEHMSANWNSALKSVFRDEDIEKLISEGSYVGAAEGVRDMLMQCKKLLQANENRKFPK